MAWQPVGVVKIPQPQQSPFNQEVDTSIYASSLSHTCDSRFLACPTTNGWIHFCDRQTAKQTFSVYAPGNPQEVAPRGLYQITCAKTIPPLMFSAVPNKSVIQGWDLRTQKVEIQFSNPNPVTALDIGMNDMCLVTGSPNGVTLLYELVLLFIVTSHVSLSFYFVEIFENQCKQAQFNSNRFSNLPLFNKSVNQRLRE